MKLIFWLSALFFLILMPLAGQNSGTNECLPLQESEDIKFIKSWTRFDRPEFGEIYTYKLISPAKISGVPCKGKVHLTSDGTLYGFVLAEPFTLNGTMFPVNSRYEARVNRQNLKSGYMVFIPKPIEIQGYQVRHKGSFLEDYKPDFYESGALSGFKSVQNTVVNGIPCRGGSKDYIILYENGDLLVCTLSEDQKIMDKSFKSGQKLVFDPNGNAYPYTPELFLSYFKGY